MAAVLAQRILSSCRIAAVDALAVRRLGTLQYSLSACGVRSSEYPRSQPWVNHGVTVGLYRSPVTCSKQRWTSTVGETSQTNFEVLEQVNEDIDRLQPSKVFAVVHISGRQFKITNNDLIVVNRIEADIGEEIYLDKVLLAGSENFTLVGRPVLSQEVVRVRATVSEHSKTAKVIVFKKKRRKNYKRKRGHRQDVTVLRINEIKLSSTLE